MPDTIQIEVPADAPDRDISRVEREAQVATRRAQIKRQYPGLRDQHGRDKALEILQERHGESVRTIRRVLYGG